MSIQLGSKDDSYVEAYLAGVQGVQQKRQLAANQQQYQQRYQQQQNDAVAADWRHAHINEFQTRLKHAEDQELIEQQQWGHMASQHLDAFNRQQEIYQQAGINQQRDLASFAHETSLHEMQLKGSQAMEELRLRHSDFFDEAKLRQNDEQFHAELDEKHAAMLQAHQEQELRDDQMALQEVNRAVANGEGRIDKTEMTNIEKRMADVNEQEQKGVLTHSQAQQYLKDLGHEHQQAQTRGYRQFAAGEGPKYEMTPQKVWDQNAPVDENGQKALFPGVKNFTVGKNGMSADFNIPDSSKQDALEERKAEAEAKKKQIEDAAGERKAEFEAKQKQADAEFQAKQKDSEFEHWDTKRQLYENERRQLQAQVDKELLTEVNTEETPGMIYGTNKRSRTAVERNIEAKKRVDAALPPDLYGKPNESYEDYRAKHSGQSAPQPGPSGQSAPQAAPQQPPVANSPEDVAKLKQQGHKRFLGHDGKIHIIP